MIVQVQATTVWIVNPFDNLLLEDCRPQRMA